MARRIEYNITDIRDKAGKTRLVANLFRNTSQSPPASHAIILYSDTGFTNDDILCVGDIGSRGAEIVYLDGSPFHTDPEYARRRAFISPDVKKDHIADEVVHRLRYDAVEVHHAPSTSGVKTLLVTKTINPEMKEFVYDEETMDSGFYFLRYKNSKSGAEGEFTQPIAVNGSPENSVGNLFNRVLDDQNVTYDRQLTVDRMIAALNRMLVDMRGRLHRWSHSTMFDQKMGKIAPGIISYELPADIDDGESKQAIYQIRVKDNCHPFKFIERDKFNDLYSHSIQTVTRAAYNQGATTMSLEDTSDLTEGGVLRVSSSTGTTTIEYTGKNDATNTITGVTGLDQGASNGAVVWQTDIGHWEDYYYTVYDHQIHVYPIPQHVNIGKNIYIDYYAQAQTIKTEADQLDVRRYDMAYYWMSAYVRSIRENDGKMDPQDSDYQKYHESVERAKRRDVNSHSKRRPPKMSGIMYPHHRKDYYS